ncbi:unnamed protein product, partial [Didymodactylos carnosus]
ACEASIEKRSAAIAPLRHALPFLPEDLKSLFKPKINEYTEKFAEEENAYKRKFKENVGTLSVEKVGELALQCEEEKRDELFEMLHTGVKEKLENHWRNLQNALNNENMQDALNSMKEIITHKEYIRNIPDVDRFYSNGCILINTSVIDYTETVSSMFQIEKIQMIDRAVTNIILYIEFGEKFHLKFPELLPEKELEKIKTGVENIYNYFCSTSSRFDTAISELDIKSLLEIANIMKRSNEFLNKVRSWSCRHKSIETFLTDMKNIKLYSDMMSELKNKIDDLKKNVSLGLISDETTRFETTRDKFFSALAMSFKILKSISSEFGDILLSTTDFQRLETELKQKVEDLKEKLLFTASKNELSSLNSDQFRIYYSHLVSFDKCLRVPEIKIRDNLELAEAKILEKVMLLSEGIASLSSDVTKVAELLEKMKFYAENISMFDTKINERIDEVLKSYKTKHGSSILSQLTMILERSDVGSRLISEHSCLSGENWRKRREKMQKQDDLDYVMGALEGDDLVKDVLCSRYKTFRRTYDDLVSRSLGSFNLKTQTEPNLEVLISQTKFLIGEVVQETNVIIWKYSFRDKIPELLAHIFAIWTLKNTQHYNNSRGIDESRAYLLMPHVAQVIAIFRILGIDCGENITIKKHGIVAAKVKSNHLINNLVQIGTGE